MKKYLPIIIMVSIITIIGILLVISINKKYTITFDSNGGSEVVSQKLHRNSFVKKPENPSKNNYRFVMWTLNGEKYDFSTSRVTSSITLKAVWKEDKLIDENIKHFIITFDTDGGNEIESQIIRMNGKVSIPETPIKEGYTFVEWTSNGKEYDFNNKVVKDIVLIAKWKSNSKTKKTPINDIEKEEDIDKCITIKFIIDEDYTSTTSCITKNSTIYDIPNYENDYANRKKQGYIQDGWLLNDKRYNEYTKINKDLVLKANWIKITSLYDEANIDNHKDLSRVVNIIMAKKHYEDLAKTRVNAILGTLESSLDNKKIIDLFDNIDSISFKEYNNQETYSYNDGSNIIIYYQNDVADPEMNRVFQENTLLNALLEAANQ